MSLMIEALMKGMMKDGSAIIILPNGYKKKKKTEQDKFEDQFNERVGREGVHNDEMRTAQRVIPSPTPG